MYFSSPFLPARLLGLSCGCLVIINDNQIQSPMHAVRNGRVEWGKMGHQGLKWVAHWHLAKTYTWTWVGDPFLPLVTYITPSVHHPLRVRRYGGIWLIPGVDSWIMLIIRLKRPELTYREGVVLSNSLTNRYVNLMISLSLRARQSVITSLYFDAVNSDSLLFFSRFMRIH